MQTAGTPGAAMPNTTKCSKAWQRERAVPTNAKASRKKPQGSEVALRYMLASWFAAGNAILLNGVFGIVQPANREIGAPGMVGRARGVGG
jgi:hypothetical protein